METTRGSVLQHMSWSVQDREDRSSLERARSPSGNRSYRSCVRVADGLGWYGLAWFGLWLCLAWLDLALALLGVARCVYGINADKSPAAVCSVRGAMVRALSPCCSKRCWTARPRHVPLPLASSPVVRFCTWYLYCCGAPSKIRLSHERMARPMAPTKTPLLRKENLSLIHI